MAKINVVGDAVVIKSEVKFDDLLAVAKYRPEALVLMGGKDNKDEIFRVGVTSGLGEIGTYGASFGAKTHDDDGKAVITIVRKFTGDDIKEQVADVYGGAMLKLAKIEEAIPAVLAEISEERAGLMANICVE